MRYLTFSIFINYQLPLGKFVWTTLLAVLSSPMLIMSFCSSYIRSYEAKCCYELSNPINCQFWHHSCIWLKALTQEMVSHPYLIFRNKQDIKHFLYSLPLSNHKETLYEPHCGQCWVKFTHCGHVILQLILYHPHKLPILISQLHPAWRATPRYGVTPLPYL